MNFTVTNLLLTDYIKDDSLFFKEALNELSHKTNFITINSGDLLIKELSKVKLLPDAIFLDLNMSDKNSFECLSDIRAKIKFNTVPIIITPTSFDNIINSLHKNGAQHYICKPTTYSKLKNVINNALKSLTRTNKTILTFENFILKPKAIFKLTQHEN